MFETLMSAACALTSLAWWLPVVSTPAADEPGQRLLVGTEQESSGDLVDRTVAPMSTPVAAHSNSVVTKSLHVNMRGMVGGANSGSRELGVQYVVQKLNSGAYLSISLNEVCPDQVAAIASRITTSYHNVYYAAYDAKIGHHGSNQGCVRSNVRQEYGNAVFQNLSLSSVSAHLYSVSDPPSAGSGSHIYRNIICLKTSYIMLGYWGCSTHLSPNAGSYVAQRNELAFIMAAYNSSSTAMHIMGDLNSNRHPHLTAIHSAFTEADINNPKRATGDGGGPIDYIFGRSVSSVYVNQAISADLVWTDHRAIAGYFRSPY